MTTILERREAATGRRERVSPDISLAEQKRRLERATKKTVGLASRAYKRTLERELEKLRNQE